MEQALLAIREHSSPRGISTHGQRRLNLMDLIRDGTAVRLQLLQRGQDLPGEAVLVGRAVKRDRDHGSVAIDAHWSVRRFGDENGLSGRSLVREPVAGADWNALVAAHSRALGSVSRDIANAIARSASP